VTDPKRLAESGSEASEALRGILRASRDDLPGAARLEGLAARLGPLLGGAAVGTTVEPAAPDPAVGPEAPAPDPSLTAGTASGGGAAAKALGVGVAVVALVGGAWLLTRPDPVTAPSDSPPAAQAPAVSRSEPAATPNEPTPLPSAVESAAPPAKGQAPEGGRSHASGPSESALLAQAQAALRSNPQRALALTREHKRRFPSGALAQEREVIAIEALNRIGDGDAARKRAKEFETSYPGSAHRRKVQNATKP
jgi:hypothetical protein